MADHRTRSGSLQFYPRVRAKKVIPSANWKYVSKDGVGLMGFIGYKAGMVSAYVKDDTEDSMTKGKRIIVPATVIECPALRIYSVRFYKEGKVAKDIVVDYDVKSLKKVVKKPKNLGKIEDAKIEDYDDVRVIVYSVVKNSGVGKKKANIIELALSGELTEKINFIKERIGKNISVKEVFSEGLVDIHAVTKGYGTQGPVKRFGITLKANKSEKGQRRPGSLAPWHPARVTFRAPQAGQTGGHSRMVYNNLILEVGSISEKDINLKEGFNRYGKLKEDYILLRGSVPGPKKKQMLITPAIRPTKKQAKKKMEVLELR